MIRFLLPVLALAVGAILGLAMANGPALADSPVRPDLTTPTAPAPTLVTSVPAPTVPGVVRDGGYDDATRVGC